jgi:hypothetical protein
MQLHNIKAEVCARKLEEGLKKLDWQILVFGRAR